ncbi:MAG: glycosyltransferase [Phycisphaerae bacterium]|nr:glycosyltransferase [Phycisphaerae bacterium]
MKKLKLLIVSGTFPNIQCGISKHVEIVANSLADQFDLHVLTSADDCVDTSIAKNYTVHPIIKSWKLLSAPAIRKAIIKLNPDIVNIQNPTAKYCGIGSFLMSVVAPSLKHKCPHIRIVVMQHDIAVGRAILRWRYKPLFKAADAITVSNQRDRQAIFNLGIAEEKVLITPMTSHFDIVPADKQMKRQARDILTIDNDALCISYFGFVHPGRNIDLLLKAASIIKNQGRKIKIIIIGGSSKGAELYYAKCQNLADELGIKDDVIWTGYATAQQISDGLAASDLFVSLPSRGADMRNTSILTAILACLPIITLENPKYLRDPDLDKLNCITIKQLNVNDLVNAIEKAASQEISNQALLQSRQALLPEKIWARHMEVNRQAFLNL